ncbi:hypothetical protein [Paraliobacillus sp. JSM ZJ581]|uniref:hypothetical protein n=1 Tax=Paraliobacillus sp. JSM ZJ581 TaxID=3342118 RepID=UPI0035A97077
MKEYYLYEIEANGNPIYESGEWETLSQVTKDKALSSDELPVAYGEIREGVYIELF